MPFFVRHASGGPDHSPSPSPPLFAVVAAAPQLLRGGSDVSRRNPNTHQSVLDIAVSITCPASRGRIVKTILAAEAENSGGGSSGGSSTEGGHSTSLRAACRAVGAGGFSAVKLLLEGGVEADAAPPAGEGRRQLRPLHIAAVHGNVEAVSGLTLRGCRLDVKTMDPSRCVVRMRVWFESVRGCFYARGFGFLSFRC